MVRRDPESCSIVVTYDATGCNLRLQIVRVFGYNGYRAKGSN